jgi:hypothetical protein
MKPIIIAMLLTAMIATGLLGVIIGKETRPTFCDGEGNRIPEEAVNLLVQSQYVILTPTEDSILNHYFPKP